MNSVRGLTELVQMLETPKQLAGTYAWRPVSRKNEIGASLEIEAIIQNGITFRANCNPDLPEESVALMLFTETRHKPRAFCRIDWRGTQHDNLDKRLAGEMFGQDAGRTHFHDIRLHLHIDYDRLFLTNVDLPIAKKLDKEPENFQQLLEEAAILLEITNLRNLPHPPWNKEPRLL